jgi:hypothetical protein
MKDLEQDEWIQIEQMANCLEPYALATQELSGEASASVAIVLPLLIPLMFGQTDQLEDTLDIRSFRSDLELYRRYQLMDNSVHELFSLASVLHPSWKDVRFLQNPQDRTVLLQNAQRKLNLKLQDGRYTDDLVAISLTRNNQDWHLGSFVFVCNLP